MIDLKRKENCTGCKACGDICPKGAISFQTDKEGFWYPEVIRRNALIATLREGLPRIEFENSEESQNVQTGILC